MKKRIIYLASFDIESNKLENRNHVLASTNKINYIVNVLNSSGFNIDIISTSHTMNRKCYAGKTVKWNENTVTFLPTTWRGGLFFKILNACVLQISLLYTLFSKIKPNDTVIVYHSYGFLWVSLLLKMRGATVISECEEIYGDIFGKRIMSFLEHKALRWADSYIYPTELLNSQVNKKNKPYLVVHGAYKDVGAKFFSDSSNEVVDFEPTLYHVAYTGILDHRKGCLDIVRAAEFLDESFHIHILGFGSESDLKQLLEEIERIKSVTKCKVSFDGVKRGLEYTNYLSHVDLGVCPLDPHRKFTLSQFPSKIISYMAVGVPVLCSEVRSIINCDVADAITFYKGNAPTDIAKGIKDARNKVKIDTITLLKECDQRFKRELNKLILLNQN